VMKSPEPAPSGFDTAPPPQALSTVASRLIASNPSLATTHSTPPFEAALVQGDPGGVPPASSL
jgi:hypothetical protein